MNSVTRNQAIIKFILLMNLRFSPGYQLSHRLRCKALIHDKCSHELEQLTMETKLEGFKTQRRIRYLLNKSMILLHNVVQVFCLSDYGSFR
jgi:hypothetical protein